MALFKKIMGQFIDREPRIMISPIHNITLHLLGKIKPFFLYNLSGSGLAILLPTPEDMVEFPKGQMTNGRLMIRDNLLHIGLEYIHQSPHAIGCRITNTHDGMKKQIYDFFEYELQSTKMRYYSPKQLKAESDGLPYFFMGPNNCYLYYVAKDNFVVRFFISYFGNVVEMNASRRLSYGLVYDGSDMEKEVGLYYPHDDSVLTHNFTQDSTAIFEPVLRFVGGLRELNPSHKKDICDKLESTLNNKDSY